MAAVVLSRMKMMCLRRHFRRSISGYHRNRWNEQRIRLESTKQSIAEALISRIRATGPLTVAQYMREILTGDKIKSYYMKDGDNVLGAAGDFFTSPEISQVFGELLAIWCVDQWNRMGRPAPFQLVEFGPGRGTLADDILKVFAKFTSQLSVHLIELSPALRSLQQRHLCGDGDHGTTIHGFPITWHEQLSDVPHQFSIYIAHEFFDALPVHKFQMTERGWSEVLVDVDLGENDASSRLRFVLSPFRTPAVVAYLEENDGRRHVEVSPQSGALIEETSKRIVEDGGVLLVADYGYDEMSDGDTFRAFKDHKLHDPLCQPGTADLTADVDFGFLRKRALQNKVLTFGPVTQRFFLQNLGIELRLEELKRKCRDEAQLKQLTDSCQLLVNPCEMGDRFKFFGIYPATMKPFFDSHPPSGFYGST